MKTQTTRRATVREASGGLATFGAKAMIKLITPGLGSSGYYSPEVLEQAAKDKVFPKGTQMFLDHPGEGETFDRPERSVRDLAGVLAEDARWTGDALVAQARIYEQFRTVLKEMQGDIGVSIRATASMGAESVDGAPVVGRLLQAQSVDFVTKAGRGGAFQVLEAARRGEGSAGPVAPSPAQLEAAVESSIAAAFGRPGAGAEGDLVAQLCKAGLTPAGAHTAMGMLRDGQAAEAAVAAAAFAGQIRDGLTTRLVADRVRALSEGRR